MVEVQPVSSIHSGLWSFNSLLAAAGITFFVVQSPFGIILSVVNALVAVGVQVAITPIFSQVNHCRSNQGWTIRLHIAATRVTSITLSSNFVQGSKGIG